MKVGREGEREGGSDGDMERGGWVGEGRCEEWRDGDIGSYLLKVIK